MSTNQKLSASQQSKIDKAAGRTIYKQDSMIQRSRIRLTLREQKCVLFAISKLDPKAEDFGVCELEIKELFALCGLKPESYTELKATLKGLADKSWWGDDPEDKNVERLYRWFADVIPNRRSGRVKVEFHKNMKPFLLQVAGKEDFYTSYSLKYVLPMKSQYAPRLYELLKSYQKNNIRWYFDIDELKKRLDCQGYGNFKDFRRRVLEPAVEEINKYTDINILYKAEKEGTKVTRVWFGMVEKTESELREAEKNGPTGQYLQMNIFDDSREARREAREDPINRFIADGIKKKHAEKEGE